MGDQCGSERRLFQRNPTENVSAKSNPPLTLKENLEVDEYLKLLNTPCLNEEIKSAFIFSCYTGLRWVDVKKFDWKDIKGSVLTTRIIQAKTGRPVTLTLHLIAESILEKQRKKAASSSEEKVFALPSADGANKALDQWMASAGIDKHITWSCARLSFSILLQDRNVDDHSCLLYGMVWKSTGDDEIRKYDFAYDKLNRLTTAEFTQYTSSTFNVDAGIDFSLRNMSYDAHGNILAWEQQGWKFGGSITVDSLVYNYMPTSNKLKNVIDLAMTLILSLVILEVQRCIWLL
jgi:hypothetical protein